MAKEVKRYLVRDLKRLSDAAESEFSHYLPLFTELRDAIDPSLGRFSSGERRSDPMINKRLVDSTARRALRTLTSGLMAGMTSPSRPWFKLGVMDDQVGSSSAVKEWLHVVEGRMYEVLRQSNAYRMLSECYRNLGVFGTFCGMIHFDFENVIHCHSFPVGRFVIAEGDDGDIEFMKRDLRMTVRQVVDQFGYDQVSQPVRNQYDNGRDFDKIDVCHAVYRRRNRDTKSPLSTDKPWASVYWEAAKDHLLEESGYSINPLLVPRWEQVDGEPWSPTSPGIMALGDSRQLQVNHRQKAIAVEKSIDPPLIAVANFVSGSFKNVPGGVTVTSTQDLRNGGLRPAYEVKPDINGMNEIIYDTRKSVDSAFFVDLFLMTAASDRRQVTAREIAERHEEKLLVLGPVLESLDHALLQPLIQATFHHMQEAGILPPPPDEIVDSQIKVEYISALAQAQKMVGVAPIERVVGFAATLEQIKPGTIDLIDAEQTLRTFSELTGPPPSMLHTPDEIKRIREQKAEAEQAATMMQAAPQMAQAAKLISEASARGEEGIQRGAPL